MVSIFVSASDHEPLGNATLHAIHTTYTALDREHSQLARARWNCVPGGSDRRHSNPLSGQLSLGFPDCSRNGDAHLCHPFQWNLTSPSNARFASLQSNVKATSACTPDVGHGGWNRLSGELFRHVL